MSGMKFSLYKMNGKFSNGLSHGMVKFGDKGFPKTMITLLNKVCSQHSDGKVIILAEYATEERAEEVKDEILLAYKQEKDYILPKE